MSPTSYQAAPPRVGRNWANYRDARRTQSRQFWPWPGSKSGAEWCSSAASRIGYAQLPLSLELAEHLQKAFLRRETFAIADSANLAAIEFLGETQSRRTDRSAQQIANPPVGVGLFDALRQNPVRKMLNSQPSVTDP